MDKEIKDEHLNNTAEEGHGLTADKIAHLLEHLGDEVIRDMLDSAGLDYDDPLGENEADKGSAEDETAEEEYVGKRFRREPEEAEKAEEAREADEAEVAVEEAEESVEEVGSEARGSADETVEEASVVSDGPEKADASKAPDEPEAAEETASAGSGEVPPETDSEEVPGTSESADNAGSQPENSEKKVDDKVESTGDKDGDGSENPEEKDGNGSEDEKTEPDSKSADGDSEAKGKRKKKSHRKVPLVRRLLFVFVLIGVLLLPIAVHFIYISATLNSDDPIQYSEHVDEISCTDGVLKVNNINVAVPTDGTEEYSISYSWSEEDEKYPSVPHAITAVYKGDESARKYSISLYRNETIPTAEIPQGKNADNWFDDWQASEDDEQTVQAPLQFDNIKGFYISPKPNPDDPEVPPEYDNYSFYFAVQDADGVSIYVLEGVCIDEQYHKEFAGIMDTCIQSIAIKVPGSEQS